MKVSVSVSRGELHAGDVVRGTVSSSAGGSVREVAVRLGYREKSVAATAWARSLDRLVLAGPGEVAPGASWDFELALPIDALPSYRTKNGELDWFVITSIDGRDDQFAPVKVSPSPAPA
jgi:hypothetical protein